MNELIAIKVIAQMHCDFSTKFGIPRQSGLVKALKGTVVFAPEYRQSGRCARIGRLFPHMADLAIFRGRAGGLVAHGAAAAHGREYPHGRVRHTFPVPA